MSSKPSLFTSPALTILLLIELKFAPACGPIKRVARPVSNKRVRLMEFSTWLFGLVKSRSLLSPMLSPSSSTDSFGSSGKTSVVFNTPSASMSASHTSPKVSPFSKLASVLV